MADDIYYGAPNDYRDYLQHHGILGMKWGVRRYQNYDGSLTQRGVKRYRTAEKIYGEKKDIYKKKKQDSNASKVEVRKAKEQYHKAKTDLKKTYNELKKDKAADKGKSLYNKGKTITGGARVVRNTAIAASIGASVAKWLNENGHKKEAEYLAAASAGTMVVGAVLGLKNRHQDKKLRAYYTHTSTALSKALDAKARRMADKEAEDEFNKWDIDWETGEMTRKKRK